MIGITATAAEVVVAAAKPDPTARPAPAAPLGKHKLTIAAVTAAAATAAAMAARHLRTKLTFEDELVDVSVEAILFSN